MCNLVLLLMCVIKHLIKKQNINVETHTYQNIGSLYYQQVAPHIGVILSPGGSTLW
jgi:hypothetical protein